MVVTQREFLDAIKQINAAHSATMERIAQLTAKVEALETAEPKAVRAKKND